MAIPLLTNVTVSPPTTEPSTIYRGRLLSERKRESPSQSNSHWLTLQLQQSQSNRSSQIQIKPCWSGTTISLVINKTNPFLLLFFYFLNKEKSESKQFEVSFLATKQDIMLLFFLEWFWVSSFVCSKWLLN